MHLFTLRNKAGKSQIFCETGLLWPLMPMMKMVRVTFVGSVENSSLAQLFTINGVVSLKKFMVL